MLQRTPDRSSLDAALTSLEVCKRLVEKNTKLMEIILQMEKRISDIERALFEGLPPKT